MIQLEITMIIIIIYHSHHHHNILDWFVSVFFSCLYRIEKRGQNNDNWIKRIEENKTFFFVQPGNLKLMEFLLSFFAFSLSRSVLSMKLKLNKMKKKKEKDLVHIFFIFDIVKFFCFFVSKTTKIYRFFFIIINNLGVIIIIIGFFFAFCLVLPCQQKRKHTNSVHFKQRIFPFCLFCLIKSWSCL